MQKVDLVIVTWHQTYLSSYAGGYVRLKKFLKRMPQDIEYILLDNQPSIYKDVISLSKIKEYKSPDWINNLQNKVFILWFLFETISSSIILYQQCVEYAKKNRNTVFYFPTGEFLQLYIVSLLIKFKYPTVKTLLDILNYGILDKDYITYFKRLHKNGIGLLRSIIITMTILFSHTLMSRTINHADYIVTVSSAFVNKIKKDYKKNSINFTPSGVDIPNKRILTQRKKYLGVYIGRMTTEKGIFDVLKVWREVCNKIPEAKLVLAGYADSQMTKVIANEIKSRELENNVHFVGDVTESKKYELLTQASIFLHLAKREPLFPVITILEAFSVGTPVMIYDMDVYTSAKKEFSFSNESIFVIENGSYKIVAKKIEEVAKYNNEKMRVLQKSAIKNASLFNWDIIARKEFAIIRSIIHK